MNAEPFYRLLPNRVWRTYLGGGTLDAISGVQPPEDGHFPEDWILSTTRAVNVGREKIDEGISRVLSSSGEPVSLTELLECFPEQILGGEHLKKFGKQPGFLLKYLDSSTPTPARARDITSSGCGRGVKVTSTWDFRTRPRRRNCGG